MPAENDLPLKGWWQDESRFGLHTIRRRRLTLRGVKPIGIQQFNFEWLYLSGIVAPTSGEAYFEAARKFNTATFQAFIDNFAALHPETLNLVVLDNAKVHHAHALVLPANVRLLFLPPYAPELNPVERIWLALKSKLAWLCLPSLAILQERLDLALATFSDAHLQSLSNFPFIAAALNSLPP